MNYDENSIKVIACGLLILIILNYKLHLLTLFELESELNMIINNILARVRINYNTQNFTEKTNEDQPTAYINLLETVVLLKKQFNVFLHQIDTIMK